LNLRWSVCPYCSAPVLGGAQLQPTEATPAATGFRRAQRAEEVSEAPVGPAET
jgi:hypothetical protein